jgi:hypothetical protein
MTPKEKAKELINKDWNSENWNFYDAKICALICVEEMILSHEIWATEQDECIDYLLLVKSEINKL